MDEKFRQLIELGAGDFEQADANLIAHLEGTRCLLKEWHSSDLLQQCGLYHLAYGSWLNSDRTFANLQRQEVKDVIGEEAENVVYHYFACEQEAFFAQFGKTDQPIFYDRITNTQTKINTEMLLNLCALVAAKETDLMIYDPAYAAKHAKRLEDLFSRMQDFLSISAKRKIDYILTANR